METMLRKLPVGIQDFEKLRTVGCLYVDKYDKPLLESMGDEALNTELRAVLKPFYGVLKSADAFLRFVMLTGGPASPR